MINHQDIIASIVILIGAVILIVINVFRLNPKDKTWKLNKEVYMQIISMALVTISMLMKITMDNN